MIGLGPCWAGNMPATVYDVCRKVVAPAALSIC